VGDTGNPEEQRPSWVKVKKEKTDGKEDSGKKEE